MKIVHVNTTDTNTGAGIAAHRLHQALLGESVDSNMLVMRKSSDEEKVLVAREGDLEKSLFSNFRKYMLQRSVNKYKDRDQKRIFSTAQYGLDITKHPLIKAADIIHLHWINGGYLSLNSLEKIKQLNKKIVWTFHDMWAFTGGCHYSNFCTKYEQQCGDCPLLKTKNDNDITRKIWKKKEKFFKDLELDIITCSSWLGDCAKKSSLLKDKNITVIPNVLDEDIFKPIDKAVAKDILNLGKEKKYISFGAMNSTSSPRKGWHYLKKALEIYHQKNPNEPIELLVFGASGSKDIEELPFKTRFLGRVYDEYTLSIIYNASDLFLAPSLEDNLPNTILESLHCGTPVVSFNVGGIPDMIEHKQNGYLAEYKKEEELAEGIEWGIQNRKKAKKRASFEKNLLIRKFKQVYNY